MRLTRIQLRKGDANEVAMRHGVAMMMTLIITLNMFIRIHQTSRKLAAINNSSAMLGSISNSGMPDVALAYLVL